MNKKSETTHPVLWFLLTAIAVAVVTVIFLRGFQQGVKVGANTPPDSLRKADAPVGPDFRKLRIATPEVVAKGKQLFATNCVSCHGAEGKGDGPKSAELNPKPRNYQTEQFKNGNAPLKLAATLQKGLGQMPAFPLMPVEDRFAIVHFVRTLIPNPTDDDSAAIAALPTPEQSVSNIPAIAATEAPGPRIPIQLAMKLIAEESNTRGAASTSKLPLWLTQKNVNAR
ncbi:MAG: c-type cytochrome [bacterium]|nr:c-type cytochrome [bacterium]